MTLLSLRPALAALLVVAASRVFAIGPGEHAKVGAKMEKDGSANAAAVERGRAVFNRYCITCHGPKADGNGRAAKLYDPKPANLVSSDKNDAYKELIVRRGGAVLGRSPHMPPWNEELSEAEIKDVVAFLHSISKR